MARKRDWYDSSPAEVRVERIAADLALVAASYDEIITMKAGTESKFGGYFTGVAVETLSGWKLRSLHWSSPASTP
ncbi:MAG: nuclear transport factor 2 family protein [Planctomycetota bacterium]|nr:nuclear transport factor 2 family protein [Planctomycetota bacterium]